MRRNHAGALQLRSSLSSWSLEPWSWSSLLLKHFLRLVLELVLELLLELVLRLVFELVLELVLEPGCGCSVPLLFALTSTVCFPRERSNHHKFPLDLSVLAGLG